MGSSPRSSPMRMARRPSGPAANTRRCQWWRVALGEGNPQTAGQGGAHLAGVELFAFDGGCAETFAAEQGSHRLLGQRRLKGVELLHEVFAGLVEQGLQTGLIPTEPWPAGLLPGPGGVHPVSLIASPDEAIRCQFALQAASPPPAAGPDQEPWQRQQRR